MSAICAAASGLSRWFAAPLAFGAPRGLAESLAAPVATARFQAWRFFEALRGAPRKRPGGSGGPGEPPKAGPTAWSHWDDPALWMLMMH